MTTNTLLSQPFNDGKNWVEHHYTYVVHKDGGDTTYSVWLFFEFKGDKISVIDDTVLAISGNLSEAAKSAASNL